MSDDFTWLFDALLDLRMDWQAARERYGSLVAGHLRAGLADGGLAPSALALIAADVVRYSAATEQISKCIEHLDGILDDAEEARVSRIKLVPPPVDSGSPQGDGRPF